MKSSITKKLIAFAVLVLAQWAVLAHANPSQGYETNEARVAPVDTTVSILRVGDGSSSSDSAISFPTDSSQLTIRSVPENSPNNNAGNPLTYIQYGYRY